jgi:hypothetical protein
MEKLVDTVMSRVDSQAAAMRSVIAPRQSVTMSFKVWQFRQVHTVRSVKGLISPYMHLQISGGAPVAVVPLPVDDRTMRILTSSRPAPSVNKNFLTRTVAALETENKMAKVSQMWSERQADKKFEEVTKMPAAGIAHTTSVEAANERSYWAAQKAMAATKEKLEAPAIVTQPVAASTLPDSSRRTRPHHRSRSRHRHHSKESSRKASRRHHHRKHRRRDRSSSVSSAASGSAKPRTRRRSPSGSSSRSCHEP